MIRQGVENMRKLVYAFYDPNFSFGEVIKKYPDAGGAMTDCLSGDVNEDFSELWRQIREFVPLPDEICLMGLRWRPERSPNRDPLLFLSHTTEMRLRCRPNPSRVEELCSTRRHSRPQHHFPRRECCRSS